MCGVNTYISLVLSTVISQYISSSICTASAYRVTYAIVLGKGSYNKEQAEGAQFEREVQEEQERKRKKAEEAKERRQAFKEKASMWH